SEGVVGPGAMHVHGHLGVGATGDVVEEDCRAAFTYARQRAAGSRQIGLEFHLLGHAQQLLLALEYGQKLTKILVSTHRDTLSVRPLRGVPRFGAAASEWISNRAVRTSQLHDDRIGCGYGLHRLRFLLKEGGRYIKRRIAKRDMLRSRRLHTS